ncbi:Pecanex-like protein 4 [Trichoplax sp. H2]|nr:Pecanex-like protein 4 [Trichoplax sp. H2]|eukprot:RDD42993.1 Pecanex-like protein 4 [Trichoplax sp. H2]
MATTLAIRGEYAPLINDYKAEFFWRRFVRTILGGPNVYLHFKAPRYIYFFQILLLFVPWILGGIFTIFVELIPSSINIPSLYYAIIYGGIITTYSFILHYISYIFSRRVNVIGSFNQNVHSEELEMEFTSCCNPSTWYFIFGNKKHIYNIILHPICAGGLCALIYYYLLPSNIITLFSASSAWVPIYTMGWISLSIAQYSLIVTCPPEPAVYRTSQVEELEPYRRPFYLAAIAIFSLATSTNPSFALVRTVLYIVCCCLPLLWSLGILSPLDALLPWLGEQLLIIMYGGSPMANDIRLLIQVVFATCIFLPTCFISAPIFTIIYSACFGYLLSIDLCGLALPFYSKIRKKTKHNPLKSPLISSQSSSVSTMGWKLGTADYIIHVVMLVLVTSIATATSIISINSIITAATKTIINSVLMYTIIALLILIKITGDLQGVYLFWGLLPNPFYPRSADTKEKFLKRKKQMKFLGILYRVLLLIVAPLLMLAYLGLNLNVTAGTNTLSLFVFGLGTVRTTRWVWQSTIHALFEMSVVFLITLILPSNSTWINFGLGLQLFIVAVARNRLQLLVGNLYMATLLSVTSYTIKKQRARWTVPLLVVLLLTLPISVAMILLASTLSAPLLPLFTAPIFLVGFPRPRRIWPNGDNDAASRCQDTVYYQQLLPVLSSALSKMIGNGVLREPSPGSQYLLRFQDRLIWVVVLERGYGYCNLNIKGLEMQETSCHTVEAARIDDIFQLTFERGERGQFCQLNRYFFNILQPVDATYLKTYSDARSVLTGILDSPDNIKLLTSSFANTLIWTLGQHLIIPHLRQILCKSDPNTKQKQNKSSLDQPAIPKAEVRNQRNSIEKDTMSTIPAPGSRMLIKRNKDEEDYGKERHDRSSVASEVLHDRSRKKSVSDSIWSADDHDSLFGSDDDARERSNELASQRKSKGAAFPRDDSFLSAANSVVNHGDEDNFIFGSPAVDVNKKRASKGTTGAEGDSIFSMPNSVRTDSQCDQDQIIYAGPAVDINCKKQSIPTMNYSSLSGYALKEEPLSLTESCDMDHNFSRVNLLYLSKKYNIELPPRWNDLPIDADFLDDLIKRYFRQDWFQHVLNRLAESSDDDKEREKIKALATDQEAVRIFAEIIMLCYAAVDVFGVPGGNAEVASIEHIYRSYQGNISPSSQLSWLSENKALKNAIISAYRYAVKLVYDTAILGEVTSLEELSEYLQEYDNEWTIGTDKSLEWSEGILKSQPHLYSLDYNKSEATYTTRLLTLQDVLIHVGILSSECIQSQWSSLALELLYFTNDDEERYSIQAHQAILRNLTVQAADPPLGYPVYASGALSIPLFK